MKNCPVSLAVRGLEVFLGAMGTIRTVYRVYAYFYINQLLNCIHIQYLEKTNKI